MMTESKSKDVRENRMFGMRDMVNLAFRSILIGGTYNYQNMQGPGFATVLAKDLKKIYGNDKKGLSEALLDNSNILNTQTHASSFLSGLILSLEEKKAPRELIAGIRNALFGPLAGIGDSIVWYTIAPLAAGVFGSMAKQGNVMGPILFFLMWVALFFVRIPLVAAGYDLGASAVSKMKDKIATMASAASVLGLTVVGGLIASYISITILPKIRISSTTTISLQKDLLDTIFPNILPAVVAFAMFRLIKRGVSPTKLILGTAVITVILSYLHIV